MAEKDNRTEYVITRPDPFLPPYPNVVVWFRRSVTVKAGENWCKVKQRPRFTTCRTGGRVSGYLPDVDADETAGGSPDLGFLRALMIRAQPEMTKTTHHAMVSASARISS